MAKNSVYKMEGVTIDVTEVKEVLDKFGEIPYNLMRKGIRRGFAAIGKEIKAIQKGKIKGFLSQKSSSKFFNYSKSTAVKPRRMVSGLVKSITVKINADLRRGRAYLVCGPKKRATELGTPSRYAHFLEFGTKAHVIKVNQGRNAGKIFNHPGITPRPFVKPSYDSIRAKAQQMMISAVENAIKEALGK